MSDFANTDGRCYRNGKLTYVSETDAMIALSFVRKKRERQRREGREVTAVEAHHYPCEHCGGWHLTHLTQAEWDERMAAWQLDTTSVTRPA